MSDELSPLAPELRVSRWFNTAQPITLRALQGQIGRAHV